MSAFSVVCLQGFPPRWESPSLLIIDGSERLDECNRLITTVICHPASTFLELQHLSFVGVLVSMISSPGPNTTRLPIASFRILVADDFEPWRRSVCAMLREHAELQVVGEAADGREAVQKAETLKPDLIVLDIGLPTLNGIEAAKRIRVVVPGTRILFLTAINDKDMVRAALSTGAQGFVLKTDAGTELLPAVAAVLGGDDFVSSGIKGGRV